MRRLFTAYLIRLDAAYSARPFFVGQKARLLAAVNLLMLALIAVNVAKLAWFPAPGLATRLAINGVFVTAALVSLYLLPRGRLELAGSGVAFAIVGVVYLAAIINAEYVQPLGTAIQIFALSLIFL